MKSDEKIRASGLLHHLLNQSISALDFCILWQELVQENASLREVDALVKEFLENADLGALDQALACLPAPADKPTKLEARPSLLSENWSVKSQRVRDVSRAEFRCVGCGWEITFAQEHETNTEMRLPFDDFTCPFCEPPSNQGRE